MRRPAILALVSLCACGGSSGLGSREQATLGDVLQVVQAVGVVTELVQHGVRAEPETEPLCPTVSRIQGFNTLDYKEGCVPDSGLVSGELAGSVRLDIGDRVSTDLEGLTLDGVALDGDLDARATPVSAYDTRLKLDQLAPDAVELAVTVGMGQAPPFTVHGDAQRNEGGVGVPVVFDEVSLSGGGDCLAPTAGSITTEQGLYDVTFTFADDGTAAVVRSDGQEGELTVCEHDKALVGE